MSSLALKSCNQVVWDFIDEQELTWHEPITDFIICFLMNNKFCNLITLFL